MSQPRNELPRYANVTPKTIASNMIKAYSIFALFCALLHAQTVAPLSQPHQYFLNASGLPCAGCSLYSYAAGTTTPQPTYTDASGLTQNNNPVVMDAAGGAQIWVGSSSYKFALLDTDGTTLWTVDQVTNDTIQLLTGSGTTGNLVLWTGNTILGNAPVTYSGGIFTFSASTTFANPITFANGYTISASTPLAVKNVATLAAGTVTITNAAACVPGSTCIYRLTNCGVNASTAIGTLAIGTVVAGTSFVINSESATATVVTGDLSTVCWQVN